jgi:cystathionine beta-lyase
MSRDLEALREDGGLKWSQYGPDVLAAWVAEMDFGLAAAITSALHDAVDRGLTGYPYPQAEHETASAATGFWAERFGWEVDPSWVFPAPDVIEGIRRAISHLTRPDSPVVIHSPVYYPFYGMVERAGRDIVEVMSVRDGAGVYRLDLAAIDRALDEGAGSLVLCNPWNPTGRVFELEELEEVEDVVARHDARLIVDEIHAPITYSGETHIPAATLGYEGVVAVNSASKAWNLPGLKCAQVVLTSEPDRARWSEYFTPEKVGVGTFGLFASTAAYSNGVEWFDEVLRRLEANRDLLVSLIGERLPSIQLSRPAGTYLAWLDMGSYGLADPARFLLDEAGVAVTSGNPFGTGASRFVRFNFATLEEVISECVDRMARALVRR